MPEEGRYGVAGAIFFMSNRVRGVGCQIFQRCAWVEVFLVVCGTEDLFVRLQQASFPKQPFWRVWWI